MTDYKLGSKSIVDELAQFIRQVDGDHRMGAGALAEKICERFRVDAPAVQEGPPRHPATPSFFEYPSFEESVDFDPEPAQQSAQGVEALEPTINKSTGEGAMNKPKTRPRNLRSLMREGSADFGPVPARQPAPDVKALVEALEQIVRWDGFPSTGEVWEDSGEPVSYGAAFGSNGERDFMREVARKALAAYRKGGEA